jgi:hypothetical protein
MASAGGDDVHERTTAALTYAHGYAGLPGGGTKVFRGQFS